VEAQIRVEAVVTPAGTVKSVRPAQKGNARLEDVAMRELKQCSVSRNLLKKSALHRYIQLALRQDHYPSCSAGVSSEVK
jgi:hypothetical protein